MKDTTAPVVPVLANVTGECSATVTAPTTTDNDAGTVAGMTSDPLVYNSQGTFTVHWTFNDGHGNSSTANQTGIVKDVTLPVLTWPANITLGCSMSLLVPVNFSATAQDNCDPNPTITYSKASDSGFPVGTTTVTCTATDARGNQSSGTFTVTRAPLDFDGFASPIGGADATGGSFANPARTVKLKSTLPVKFTAACGGSPVLAGIHRLEVIKYSDQTTAGDPIDATPTDAATTGDQFRLKGGEWHFNLDIKATGMSVGIWLLRATLSDGSQHSVWIQIK